MKCITDYKLPSSSSTVYTLFLQNCIKNGENKRFYQTTNISKLTEITLPIAVSHAAKGHQRDLRLWKAFAYRATELSSKMRSSQITQLLFGFSKMGYRNTEMLQIVADTLPLTYHNYTPYQMVTLLHAFAALQFHSKVAFTVMAKRIAQQIDTFTPSQLGYVIDAYATLGYHHPLLFKIFKRRIFDLHKQLTTRSITLITHAYGRLKLSDDRLFALLTSEICRRVTEFTADDLSLILNTYSRLNVRNRFLLDILVGEIHKQRMEIRTRNAALVIHALAKLNVESNELLQHFKKEIPKYLKNCNLHSICLIATGFSKLNHQSNQLFELMGERVGELSKELYPRAAAALVYAFSKANVRHGPLLYHVPLHVERFLMDYSLDELGFIAYGYSKLNIMHPTLMECIIKRSNEWLHRYLEVAHDDVSVVECKEDDEPDVLLPNVLIDVHEKTRNRRVKEYRLESVLRILRAIAQLNYYHKETLKLIGDLCLLRLHTMKQRQIAEMLYCYFTCMHIHKELLDGVYELFEHSSTSWLKCFNQKDLRRMETALRVFGRDSQQFGIFKLSNNSKEIEEIVTSSIEGQVLSVDDGTTRNEDDVHRVFVDSTKKRDILRYPSKYNIIFDTTIDEDSKNFKIY